MICDDNRHLKEEYILALFLGHLRGIRELTFKMSTVLKAWRAAVMYSMSKEKAFEKMKKYDPPKPAEGGDNADP